MLDVRLRMIGLPDVLRFEIHQEHDGIFVWTLSLFFWFELELEWPFPVSTCDLVRIRPWNEKLGGFLGGTFFLHQSSAHHSLNQLHSKKGFRKVLWKFSPFQRHPKNSGGKNHSIDVLTTNVSPTFHVISLLLIDNLFQHIWSAYMNASQSYIRKLSWFLVAPQVCKTPMSVHIYVCEFLGSCFPDKILWQQICIKNCPNIQSTKNWVTSVVNFLYPPVNLT